ncbi:adaptor-related protein complex 4 sigma 1 subunit [Spinellus fusiger]|nr:adaptor-related protein complex 4 sigma 1 subunit [Spinellus fusiger]
MIHFILIVNKRCQIRFSRHYNSKQTNEKTSLELSAAKECVLRTPEQCLFFKHDQYTIVYRVYSSLYFVIGCKEENELAMLELIQNWVEAMDSYFEKVTELDIIFNLQKVHMLIDEIVLYGSLVETNQERVLAPIYALTGTER